MMEIWDWMVMTMNTSMRDLSFLQWAFLVMMIVGMVMIGLWMGDAQKRRRGERQKKLIEWELKEWEEKYKERKTRKGGRKDVEDVEVVVGEDEDRGGDGEGAEEPGTL
jgi:hypothetical protein